MDETTRRHFLAGMTALALLPLGSAGCDAPPAAEPRGETLDTGCDPAAAEVDGYVCHEYAFMPGDTVLEGSAEDNESPFQLRDRLSAELLTNEQRRQLRGLLFYEVLTGDGEWVSPTSPEDASAAFRFNGGEQTRFRLADVMWVVEGSDAVADETVLSPELRADLEEALGYSRLLIVGGDGRIRTLSVDINGGDACASVLVGLGEAERLVVLTDAVPLCSE